ncbi:unnamed protein product [Acanthoscelides obtectus]|uniref:Tyrosine-protein kinase receptor n=1 Tax=Acanthoscelides obtectus TaxID=200917 RepID=A0A9P0PMC2_ACAOB|nr:unnamed protein product [Acanthoscelides obtectus]CAK1675183.1 Insulin-like receptor [Acanthoscelides obtectus]
MTCPDFVFCDTPSNLIFFVSVCKSTDIRNSVRDLEILRDCEVIEGFLSILLFDNVNETELMKLQFPKLTEITDYFLLYRVNGLRSVGQLFPNLSVIRGQALFEDVYAFVVFEMTSLQEIGLHSLTDIMRGNVYIDKNPSLCFVHTVDWDRIIHDQRGKNLIKSLKPENECPICSSDELVGDVLNAVCPRSAAVGLDKERSRDRHLCWNRHHLQKIFRSNCTACDNNGKCCSSECLGGCSSYNRSQCTVCRHLTLLFDDRKECVKECPANYYKYLDRRCVTKEECIGMKKPIDYQPVNNEGEHPYKVFNNSCLLHCPVNHKSDGYTCVPCDGRCEKYCDGINIDSITIAKQLRGCTHIRGSLEIQIRRGTNVVAELEESLSMIEEIEGYLKIVRSFSLVSLNFLKSLKRIRGNFLDNQKYVLIILDNQNLQELWDWSKNRTLVIERGKLFFHFNPKLCFNKILQLKEIARLEDFTDLEVAPNSNGDKIACDVKPLHVNISKIGTRSVTLEWKQFQMRDDQRKLLGYIVYLIEAPYRNVTIYDGRDACGQDDWRVYDVAVQETDQTVTQLLPNLKPYRQYAFFVKTYTIASEKTGAQSDIMYFMTLPSTPSSPQNLQVYSNASDSLIIRWSPPLEPNGNVTHYIVAGKKHNDEYMLRDRDYCKDPPVLVSEEKRQPQIHTTPPPKNESCHCEGGKSSNRVIDADEGEARIKFEDLLHNLVYQKRPPSNSTESRKKRETTEFPYSNELQNVTKSPNDLDYPVNPDLKNTVQNATENGTDIWESFNFTVYGETEFFVNRLHHYTLYEVSVQACRDKQGDDDVENPCSARNIKTDRTRSKPGADNITKVKISNRSLDEVTLTWEEPEDPNGVIYRYSIEYQRVDLENQPKLGLCVNARNYSMAKSFTVSKLSPGNYSIRIMATSSARNGDYSERIYFVIEEPSTNTLSVVLIILFIFIAFSVVFGWLYRKHLKEKENMRLIQSVNPEYVPTIYVPDDWEVQRKKIELIKELGQGSFGMVWEGLARDIRGKTEIRCAIKTVNEHATNRERLEFLNEASVMKAFDTTHVVRLLGVVSQGQPTLVIMELMAHGDLKSYLRSHRPDAENYNPELIKQPPTLKQILQMAIEIADGMAYLTAKKFVHRDLAARNCMVSEDLTVKIGDFGMTRDIYETDYYRKGTKGLLPVRWMAPESLKDGVFTSSSDVWSYGVVLWEMATLASQPYQGLSNDQVLRYVIDGGVMERPENCPDKLYTLMRYCWQHKPSARPTFLKLCQLLLDDASAQFAQVSFYHSPAGAEARASRPTPSPNQEEQLTPLKRVSDRLRGYTSSESHESDELDIDTHHQFPSITEGGIRVGVTQTANGYVSGCPTNGGAAGNTTQC